MYIIIYVAVVLGKVYDSNRPGKQLTPLNCNSSTHYLNAREEILGGFGNHKGMASINLHTVATFVWKHESF